MTGPWSCVLTNCLLKTNHGNFGMGLLFGFCCHSLIILISVRLQSNGYKVIRIDVQ